VRHEESSKISDGLHATPYMMWLSTDEMNMYGIPESNAWEERERYSCRLQKMA
jgi:hypothetical protein